MYISYLISEHPYQAEYDKDLECNKVDSDEECTDFNQNNKNTTIQEVDNNNFSRCINYTHNKHFEPWDEKFSLSNDSTQEQQWRTQRISATGKTSIHALDCTAKLVLKSRRKNGVQELPSRH